MSITHTKVSAVADGSNPAEVQPSDWNAVHTIGAATITTAMLVPSPVTPGAYTNANITVDVDGRVTAAANGTGGGGGGGITNTAPANTIMLSNGTNAVASGITDNGAVVAMTGRKMQLGPTVVPTQNTVFWSSTDVAKSTFAWFTVDTVGHVGFGGNNESIPLVLRNNSTHAMGVGGTATAGGIDVNVQTGKASGTGTLTAVAIVAGASGGDVNHAIQCPAGDIVCPDGATLGITQITKLTCTNAVGTAFDATAGGLVKPGRNVDAFEVTANGAGASAIVGIGCYNTGKPLSIKNTTTGTSGIDIFADTTLNSPESAFITFYRGAGASLSNEKGGIGIIGNAGSFVVGSGLNDTAIYNYEASALGQKIVFGTGTGPTACVQIDEAGTLRALNTNSRTGKIVADTQFQVGTAGSFRSGSVTPNSNVVGSVGDFYTWTGGGAATTLWVKESGAATNTGWVSK